MAHEDDKEPVATPVWARYCCWCPACVGLNSLSPACAGCGKPKSGAKSMPWDDGNEEKKDEEENGVVWGWNMPPLQKE